MAVCRSVSNTSQLTVDVSRLMSGSVSAGVNASVIRDQQASDQPFFPSLPVAMLAVPEGTSQVRWQLLCSCRTMNYLFMVQYLNMLLLYS